MSSRWRRFAVKTGWRVPFSGLLAPRRPVILVYHGIVRNGVGLNAEVLEQHLLFLKRHFDLCGREWLEEQRSLFDRIRVLLTFDDGFRNQAEVAAPILRKHGVPAVFFVSSRHSVLGRYLWFSYLRTLEACFRGDGFRFRGRFMAMTGQRRARTVRWLWSTLLDLKPHPQAMYRVIEQELPRLEDHATEVELNDRCAGMTEEQVSELARDSLFSIGAHTVDHPFLTQCAPAEARRQVLENIAWIERLSGRKCDMIAYPLGDYSADVLQLCQDVGFKYGFGNRRRDWRPRPLELPRVGVYHDSLDELGFKIRWGDLLMWLQAHGLGQTD